MITWEELCEIEPRLGVLLDEIERVEDNPETESFCSNTEWKSVIRYDGKTFKERMISLVGYLAEIDDKRLQSSEAYQVAYHKLYHALPDCRNCGCMDIDLLM